MKPVNDYSYSEFRNKNGLVGIRTRDPRLARAVLYRTELRAHYKNKIVGKKIGDYKK